MAPVADGGAPGRPRCRFCGAPLELTVVDLGMSPLCESFLRAEQLAADGAVLPAARRACERCWLVQLELVPPEEIFTEYAYFSAYSTSWVEHARAVRRDDPRATGLGPDDLVVELASNDGYLLQHFVGTGIPILGIDPAANVAEAAEERGVPTLVAFFGRASRGAARRRGQAREPRRRQQRPRSGARPERLRGRGYDRCCAPTARRRSSSRTCCACSTASSTTRSTTSTSRTSRSRRSRRSSPPTASRSTTSRSSRPTAARCGSTRSRRAGRTRRRRPSAAAARARGARTGCARPSATRASPRTSRSRSGRCSSC